MNNFVAWIIAIIMMASIVAMGFHTMINDPYHNPDNIQLAKVVSVTNDVVEVEITGGNLYSFYGDGYEVGDIIKCIFSHGEIIDVL